MRHKEFSEEEVRQAALRRVASVFNLSIAALTPELRFGNDLKASFVSDFKYNELDTLLHDVHDVADRQTLAAFGSGALVIRTIADYCEHMVRSYRTKPDDVIYLLRLE